MIATLKEKILLKYQAPVSSAKDCALLAKAIQADTNRIISEATIRRFFGLLKSKSHLSKYNLDTLALYCGYPDFNQFSRSLSGNNSNSKLTEEFDKITRFTLNSIKKKSLTAFSQTIPRQEVNENLNAFLNSEAYVFPLIAPGGYGKSLALAHWVYAAIDNKQQVLFIQAAIFLNYINKSVGSKELSFDLDSKINVFSQWHKLYPKEPLILVIDAWEEVAYTANKQDQLIDYINKVMQVYATTIPLKIILGFRSSTWEQLSRSKNKGKQNDRTFTLKEITAHSLPPFSNEEIRSVIDIFNQNVNQPIVYEHILWDLLELLKVPFNLYLYTRLYANYTEQEVIGYNRLLEYYFKQKVFEAKYAEEKEDILWSMITVIQNNNSVYVYKKDLKQQYPIHIKREANYFNAYANLLSDGILEEERVVNKYGLYSTIVQFKHQNYLYYLTALDIIRQNNGLSSNVFKNVVWSDNFWGWKASIIAILFEIAYNNEDYDAIKQFCELPDKIHTSLQVRYTVGKAFRNNNGIRDKIIRKYAKSEKGQSYYFEQFVDTNYLYNNYTFRIAEYLKNKSTKEAALFGNSILFLAGFLKLNKQESDHYWQIVNSIDVDASIHPWSIGRKVATMLMYEGFIIGNGAKSTLKKIKHFKEIAYSYEGYFHRGLITFELPVIVPLIFLGRYRELEIMLKDTVRRTDLSANKDDFVSLLSQNQNVLPELVLDYAKYKQGKKYHIDFNKKIESALTNLANSYDDFQYQILLRWILYDYYANSGNSKKADYHYKAALQLSRFAGYDFFTLFLEINALGVTDKKKKSLLQEIEGKGFLSSAF
jgi:hypothetical protein